MYITIYMIVYPILLQVYCHVFIVRVKKVLSCAKLALLKLLSTNGTYHPPVSTYLYPPSLSLTLFHSHSLSPSFTAIVNTGVSLVYLIVSLSLFLHLPLSYCLSVYRSLCE